MASIVRNRSSPALKTPAIPRLKSASRTLAIWLIGLLGSTLSLEIFFLLRDLDQRQAQYQFDQLNYARVQTLQRTIDSALETLQSVGAFFRGSERVEREEFHTFVQNVLERHPEIDSLFWRQHVGAEQRGEFENQLREDHSPAHEIYDVNAEGGRLRAAERTDYYPILYIEPRGRLLIGMDQSALPGPGPVYRQATTQPGFAVSGLIKLELSDLDKRKPEALLVYLPIYREAEAFPEAKAFGIAAAVLQIENLVKLSLHDFDRSEMSMRLIDTESSGENRILFRYPRDQAPKMPNFGKRIKSRFDIQFGKRLLNIEYLSTENFRPEAQNYPSILLGAGLLLTLLICLYIRAAKLRVFEVESIADRLSQEVEARKATEQILRKSEERLQAENSTLSTLASQDFYAIEHLDDVFRLITEASATTLGTDRAGIWLFDEFGDKLECVDLYDRNANLHEHGMELNLDRNPAYFRALHNHRTLTVSDASTDLLSRELAASYLKANQISARLDSPIQLSGRVVGALSHEQRGRIKPWTLDEESFSGSIANLISLALKFSHNRRDEAALRLNEARYRSLVLATAQIVWTCSPEGTTIEPSPTWESYTGQIFEQYREWGWVEAVHPDDREQIGVAGKWKSRNADAEPLETEYRIRRHDGVYRLFRVRGNKVLGEDGRILEWVGTCHDITEIREAEIALRRSHLELEQQVAERTRELKEANEQLQELDRLKSEFLATMSHELRTPLNSIIGFTSILNQGIAGPINAEQTKQLGMVKNSAQHLLGLINDLLDLSRIESGRMQTSRDRFSCESVITEVVNALSPITARKGIELLVKISPGQAELCTDQKKVFQILLNLANNAVKFTEQGRVLIAADRKEQWCRFRINDTGIGIRPENMAMLFEAFRQIEGSARRRYEGTGLGLHLSQRLAELLGGRIEAESTFGQGSTFTLFLPANEDAHEPEDSRHRG